MRKTTIIFALFALSLLLMGCNKGNNNDRPLQLTPTVPLTPTTTPTPPTPTNTPTPTTAPTMTPVPEELLAANLMNTYGQLVPYIGSCVTSTQLDLKFTRQFFLEHYNSMTLENEMKPTNVLGSNTNQLTIEEAKAAGYEIPEGYTEATVPALHLNNTFHALALCAEYGLGYRAHTLQWHSQTPTWFFRENYSNTGAFVTPEVMDQRLIYYITNVMAQVYDNENGSVVYAWDVTNEYVHASNSGWEAVYGPMGLTPTYVKLAFETAYDMLVRYGLEEKVTLFYNDFNTYQDMSKILKLAAYINTDRKICKGIGMQSHLSTNYPNVSTFKSTLHRFLTEGYEVQITELDVTCSSFPSQARYYYDLMTAILDEIKNGGNITSITFWGTCDSKSWRGSQHPLLFSEAGQPKEAYYKTIQAFLDAGYEIQNNEEDILP